MDEDLIRVTTQALGLMTINIFKTAKASENSGMEPIRLPTEEEIRAATREGEAAVLALLSADVQALRDQVAKNRSKSELTTYAGLYRNVTY